MLHETGQTTSVWMQGDRFPCHAVLSDDSKADVCIVGAGIAGITTAYLLVREGKSVIVLDDGSVGAGQTQRTTAHLSNAIDDRYVNIEHWHGRDGARLAAESHTAAIDRIEAIIGAEQIDCEFERLDGYLFGASDTPPELLRNELEAAHRAGLSQVEWLARAPLPDFDTGPCLRFPRQGQFHPLKYIDGLTQAVMRSGGRIFTKTHADGIDGGPPARIRTHQGSVVTAQQVIVATNSPINDMVAIHTKQAPYLSYVAAFPVPRGAIPRALYWDTADPYHYARLETITQPTRGAVHLGDPQTEDLLIVGGEDHKTGQADDKERRYKRLAEWARERFPIKGPERYCWSGQVLETIDGLAFIGPNPLDKPNVYIATGDSGMGMTHGTIAGILLTDLIVGRKNPWAALYSPDRKSLLAADRFVQENFNVLKQYGAWMTAGDISSTDELAPGAGAILRHGLKKIAAYRDEAGVLCQWSATCPHLGCIVQWNRNEHTWDCPCHGSRFDGKGHVINGPANRDLEPAEGT